MDCGACLIVGNVINFNLIDSVEEDEATLQPPEEYAEDLLEEEELDA